MGGCGFIMGACIALGVGAYFFDYLFIYVFLSVAANFVGFYLITTFYYCYYYY
jgi:hypothetical protein